MKKQGFLFLSQGIFLYGTLRFMNVFKALMTLGLWIAVFEVVSFLLGQLTQTEVAGWYMHLNAPPFVPPPILFAVIWPVLYALIATSGWLIWRNYEGPAGYLWRIFAIYMIFNWGWTFIFFSMHQLFLGLLWLLVLQAASIILIVRAWYVLRPVSYLMLLPTCWTAFAVCLNAAYWWLNR
jgi:translocator protein